MKIFIPVLLSALYIGLGFYLTSKKRPLGNNVVNYSVRFLVINLVFIVLESVFLVVPVFFMNGINIWAFIVILLLMAINTVCIVLYKNFYVILKEDTFEHSGIFGSKSMAFYKEITEFDHKSDMVTFTAKEKEYHVLNNKKYVKNIDVLVNTIKENRK